MKIGLDSYLAICHSPEVPRICKSAKRDCPYCGRHLSVKLFKPESDICNFCVRFDKAAQIPFQAKYRGSEVANTQ